MVNFNGTGVLYSSENKFVTTNADAQFVPAGKLKSPISKRSSLYRRLSAK